MDNLNGLQKLGRMVEEADFITMPLGVSDMITMEKVLGHPVSGNITMIKSEIKIKLEVWCYQEAC